MNLDIFRVPDNERNGNPFFFAVAPCVQCHSCSSQQQERIRIYRPPIQIAPGRSTRLVQRKPPPKRGLFTARLGGSSRECRIEMRPVLKIRGGGEAAQALPETLTGLAVCARYDALVAICNGSGAKNTRAAPRTLTTRADDAVD
jgi:hypothetical protein